MNGLSKKVTGILPRKLIRVFVCILLAIVVVPFLYYRGFQTKLRQPYQKDDSSKLVIYRTIGSDLKNLYPPNYSVSLLKTILENEILPKRVTRKWILWHLTDTLKKREIIEILLQYNETYVDEPFSYRTYDRALPCEKCVDNYGVIYSLPLFNARYAQKVLFYYKNKKNYIFGHEINLASSNRVRREIKEKYRALEKGPWVVISQFNSKFNENNIQIMLQHIDTQNRNRKNGITNILLNNDYLNAASDTKGLVLFPSAKINDVNIFPESYGEVLTTINNPIAIEKQPLLNITRALFVKMRKLDENLLKKFYGLNEYSLFAFKENVLTKERELYQSSNCPADLKNIIDQLCTSANYALTLKPWSVVDKLYYPPNLNDKHAKGDKHDYYTPAPYYWPDKTRKEHDYKPYIVKDGKRVPGTILYDSKSERYDRSRFASFIGNTTTLTLAFFYTGNKEYGKKAVNNIKTWFLNKETKMNPHLTWSQVRWGHNHNIGQSGGIIETKDFYSILDCVKMLHEFGVMTKSDFNQLQLWMNEFLLWLITNKSGIMERGTGNNHGIYYDIQLMGIAAFVGDFGLLRLFAEKSRLRLYEQFAIDGTMPREMKRPTQLHYIMFSLQGAFILASIVEKAGINLWTYSVAAAKRKANDLLPTLRRGAEFALPYSHKNWKHKQSKSEDIERMLPLFFTAKFKYRHLRIFREPEKSIYEIKPRFFEHDGIMLYWNLGTNEEILD